MRLCGRIVWASALGALLPVGCLFHGAGSAELPAPGPESGPRLANDQVPVEMSFGNRSPYFAHPPETALPATVARVRLEMQAAPPPPPEQPAVIVGTAPAPAKPTPPDAPLVAALRCALERNSNEAALWLQRYEPAQREQLLALLRLLAGLSDNNLDRLTPQELAHALDQLAGIVHVLRQRAPLTLDKVCFCRKISGFGRYDALPASHAFQAGIAAQPGERVQVYAEVRNFRSRFHNGQFETVLGSVLEFHNERGACVVRFNPGTCTDRSQTPRHDYFLNIQVHVPAKLPPGLYTLWVIVKDVTPSTDGAHVKPRLARRSLDFRVVAPGQQPDENATH
jgi:hypothetical protein